MGATDFDISAIQKGLWLIFINNPIELNPWRKLSE
jgi:hypothetical protein